MLANLEKRRGGLGNGLHGDDPLAFFLIDEHLAYDNPSTAHCFQVHNNANPDRAMIAAHEAKWMAKETLEKVMWSAAEICGSTALFQKHPLERFYGNMHLHMMHGRHDIAAQIVGAAELGEPHDVNRTH